MTNDERKPQQDESQGCDAVVSVTEGESVDALQKAHIDYLNKMSSWKVFLVWFAIALACLCVFLDEGIIATAIPRITDKFHSLADVGVSHKI